MKQQGMKQYLLALSVAVSLPAFAGAEYMQTSDLLCQNFQEGDYLCVAKQATTDNATDIVILSTSDLIALGGVSFTPKMPLNLAMK